jgi:hypothetical protein
VRPAERTPEEIERIEALARVHIQQDIEKAQTTKRKRPATLITAALRVSAKEAAQNERNITVLTR